MANTAQRDVKYFHGEETHNLKAPRQIVPFIVDVLHPSSVVDIGCGVGTFLSVFDELGVKDLIGVDGNAQQAELRQSSGFDRLDQAALETVRKWRYVPGKRGGVPEAMWFNVPIIFVLE